MAKVISIKFNRQELQALAVYAYENILGSTEEETNFRDNLFLKISDAIRMLDNNEKIEIILGQD